ncbi:MAG: 50S ribosomal protein L25 [bacterium]
MIQEKLAVFARTDTGKGVCRKLRSSGQVPAVLYGSKEAPQNMIIPKKRFLELLRKHDINILVDLDFEDDNALNALAVVREIQSHPVSNRLIHVDFMRVSLDKPIEATVPIHHVGVCKGVKMGGNLELVQRDVLIEALPNQIPAFLEVDISHVNIGENLHLSDIVPPEGVRLVDDMKKTILTIHGKTEEKEEESEETVEE